MTQPPSLTIIPRAQRPKRPGDVEDDPTGVGKLASALLAVSTAGLADSGRFKRGREYANEGAVTRIHLRPGQLVAHVQGSRPQPYQATVQVATVAVPPDLTGAVERSHVSRLMPEGDELTVWCTCPDGGDACKHVVAALVAFSNELADRPELLVAWRCAPGDASERVVSPPTPERATVGTGRHLRLASSIAAPPPPPPSPFATDAWREFLGEGLPAPGDVSDVVAGHTPVGIPTAMVDRIDVGAVMRSAIDAAARTLRGPMP